MFFQAVKNNGSLYAHVYFARSGYPADPNDPEYQPLAAFGRTHCKDVSLAVYIFIWLKKKKNKSALKISSISLISAIVAYFPKSRADKKKSLLGNKDSDEGGTVTKVCPLLLSSLINNFRMTYYQ